jgi:hypothetical protein
MRNLGKVGIGVGTVDAASMERYKVCMGMLLSGHRCNGKVTKMY